MCALEPFICYTFPAAISDKHSILGRKIASIPWEILQHLLVSRRASLLQQVRRGGRNPGGDQGGTALCSLCSLVPRMAFKVSLPLTAIPYNIRSRFISVRTSVIYCICCDICITIWRALFINVLSTDPKIQLGMAMLYSEIKFWKRALHKYNHVYAFIHIWKALF